MEDIDIEKLGHILYTSIEDSEGLARREEILGRYSAGYAVADTHNIVDLAEKESMHARRDATAMYKEVMPHKSIPYGVEPYGLQAIYHGQLCKKVGEEKSVLKEVPVIERKKVPVTEMKKVPVTKEVKVAIEPTGLFKRFKKTKYETKKVTTYETKKVTEYKLKEITKYVKKHVKETVYKDVPIQLKEIVKGGEGGDAYGFTFYTFRRRANVPDEHRPNVYFHYTVVTDKETYGKILGKLQEGQKSRKTLRDWGKKLFRKTWDRYMVNTKLRGEILLTNKPREFAEHYKMHYYK